MLVKKSSEKSAKNVFLFSHEYRELKMGGRNARNNFSRNTRIVRSKNFGQKIVGKKYENVLNIHKNTVKKIVGGKKARINFSRYTNSARKNVGEKIFGKKWKKRFFYSHEYRDQKMGGKKLTNLFPETHE